MNLPMIQPEREPLTLDEAMRVGASASRLAAYREGLKTEHGSAALTIAVKGGKRFYGLTATEADAILSLLVEREAAFLTPFNVELPQ